MVQKELKRVLSKKDGQGLIPGYKGNEKVKLTKLLEVIPTRKPEQAKIGEVVRFMHYPRSSTSAYWMEGELKKRIDKYIVARESGFTRNRFMVKNLTIINRWGDPCTIPETLTINLTKNTAWSLAEEVELRTREDKAIMFCRSDVCGNNADDDKADDATTNRIKSETAHAIHPGLKLQEGINKASV